MSSMKMLLPPLSKIKIWWGNTFRFEIQRRTGFDILLIARPDCYMKHTTMVHLSRAVVQCFSLLQQKKVVGLAHNPD